MLEQQLQEHRAHTKCEKHPKVLILSPPTPAIPTPTDDAAQRDHVHCLAQTSVYFLSN